MKVVISLPAYNEEATIGKTIDDIKAVMDSNNYEYEIHVQDDGSTDKTSIIAREHGATVFNNAFNLGLAKTFKKEIKHAGNFDVFLHSDSDNQYNPKHIPELIKQVEEGNDLVLGSRFTNNNYTGTFIKRQGNKLFSHVISKLVKKTITDSTTGFRAFNQRVAKLPLINRFTYTHEQIIRAAKAGLKIKEIPITTNPTRKSKLFSSPFDYIYHSFINIARIYRDFNPIHFYGLLGLLFFIPGFLLGSFITIRIILVGESGGIPRVILCMFLMFTGIQIILSGFNADMHITE